MKHFNLIEAPICAGSPTKGSEKAYKAIASDIKASFGDAVSLTDYGTPPHDPTDYPPNMKHVGMVVEVCERIRSCVAETAKAGEIPLVVGGDHSVAMGTIAGLSSVYGVDALAVVYIDGHADINTEKSTESGYIHGMPLASSLGLCADALTIGGKKAKLRGENIHIIGARSIDKGEYPIIEANGVDLVTADKCRKLGLDGVISELLPKLEGKRVAVSLDVDSMDKTEFGSTGYLMPNGLTLDYVRSLVDKIIKNTNTISFECVEYNPTMDKDGRDKAKLLDIYKTVLNSYR